MKPPLRTKSVGTKVSEAEFALYDAAGNMLNDGNNSYQYDAKGNVLQVGPNPCLKSETWGTRICVPIGVGATDEPQVLRLVTPFLAQDDICFLVWMLGLRYLEKPCPGNETLRQAQGRLWGRYKNQPNR